MGKSRGQEWSCRDKAGEAQEKEMKKESRIDSYDRLV